MIHYHTNLTMHKFTQIQFLSHFLSASISITHSFKKNSMRIFGFCFFLKTRTMKHLLGIRSPYWNIISYATIDWILICKGMQKLIRFHWFECDYGIALLRSDIVMNAERIIIWHTSCRIGFPFRFMHHCISVIRCGI